LVPRWLLLPFPLVVVVDVVLIVLVLIVLVLLVLVIESKSIFVRVVLRDVVLKVRDVETALQANTNESVPPTTEP